MLLVRFNAARQSVLSFLTFTSRCRAAGVMLLASVFLLACSPQFDWRSSKLSSHGDRYTLTFPGKPLSAERKVNLAGASFSLMLTAVQVDSAQFALGSVPAASPAQAQVLAQALAQAFEANLKLSSAQTKMTTVALARSSGAFDVAYPVGERYATGRFIWTQNAAYELLAVGSAKDLSAETAETFIRSMQFE
jgi:hypothetical protein